MNLGILMDKTMEDSIHEKKKILLLLQIKIIGGRKLVTAGLNQPFDILKVSKASKSTNEKMSFIKL